MKNSDSAMQGVTFNDELEPVWNIESRVPHLLAFLGDREPWLADLLDSIGRYPMVANTCRKFEQAPYFRLPGHRRAFYICKKPGAGVVAVKGSEITAMEIDEMLQEFRQKRFPGSFYSMADYFVLREQKIPMALMYSEAIEEAEKALEFHVAYFERYGDLARIPFPLSLFRWPDRDTKQYVRKLQGYLNKRSFELLRLLAEDGLAVYYYYYPGTPVRVREIHDSMQSYSRAGYSGRITEIRKRMNPEKVIKDWMRLLVRMLGLGYLPVNLVNDEIGQLVRAQNVVYDGGFADVGSLQKITDVRDEREICESLWVTIIELTMSLRGLLAGGLGVNRIEHHDLPVVPFMIGCRIRDQLLKAMEDEKSQGVSFDPGIEAALSSDSLFTDLDRDLRLIFASPT